MMEKTAASEEAAANGAWPVKGRMLAPKMFMPRSRVTLAVLGWLPADAAAGVLAGAADASPDTCWPGVVTRGAGAAGACMPCCENAASTAEGGPCIANDIRGCGGLQVACADAGKAFERAMPAGAGQGVQSLADRCCKEWRTALQYWFFFIRYVPHFMRVAQPM